MNKNNKNCPGVKRLMREAAELAQPTEHYYAAPLEDNLFEWHFTVRGQDGSSFAGGIYHGRIIFPPEYPLKPPAVMLLTPNGRFEINRRICLSISDHHPETWQPSWSIRTVLLAIVGFMPTPGKGAIGALDWTDAERRKLAAASVKWSCRTCGCKNAEVLLPPTTNPDQDQEFTTETRKYAAKLSFKAAKDKTPVAATEIADPGPVAAPVAEAGTIAPVPPASSQPAQPAAALVPAATQMPLEQPTGGYFSLMVMYFLIGLISALFLRRVFRTIYSEYLEPDVV